MATKTEAIKLDLGKIMKTVVENSKLIKMLSQVFKERSGFVIRDWILYEVFDSG